MVRATASLEEKARASAYNAAWKARHRAANTDIGKKLRSKETRAAFLRAGTGEGYRLLWLNNTKLRAKRKGVPFDITLEDLEFPDVCPVLGIPLIARAGKFHDNSPSIDRIVPEKGYVKGNVQIMSYRANRIKCHASLDELRRIVAFMEREGL